MTTNTRADGTLFHTQGPALQPTIHRDVLEAIEHALAKPMGRWGKEKLMENPNSKIGVLLRCNDEIVKLRAENEALKKTLIDLQRQRV